jgi:hypothetical protein
MHQQPSANGSIGTIKIERREVTAMANAKFIVETDHPDYGHIMPGEILQVTREYMDHYITLDFAEETSDPLTRPAVEPSP